MTRDEAVTILRSYVQEHVYEDRGVDYNECPSCGWNTQDDIPKPPSPDKLLGWGWGPEPHHRQGCELRAALDVIDGVVRDPG